MLQYFHLRGTDPMSNPWVGGMDLPLIPLTGFFNMLRISGRALVIWVFYYSPIYENFGQGNFFSISKMWVIRGPFLTNFGFWPLTYNKIWHETEFVKFSTREFQMWSLYLSPLERRSPERGDRQSSSSQYHETCASKCQSLHLGNPSLYKRLNTGPCKVFV